eukprot:11177416-Lingulodinium_polyedra.AAC.1
MGNGTTSTAPAYRTTPPPCCAKRLPNQRRRRPAFMAGRDAALCSAGKPDPSVLPKAGLAKPGRLELAC